METQHTQGEWIIPKNQQLTGLRKVVTKGKNIVTLIATDFDSDEEFEANTKLIAAAPELLEALKELEEFSSENHPKGFKYNSTKHHKVLIKAMNAIKKATE